MKIIVDLDPKLQRQLDALAGARNRQTGELIAELLDRVINRKAAPPAAPTATGPGKPKEMVGVTDTSSALDDLVLLLEPMVSRFRLLDADGAQRKALLAEMQMFLPDPSAERLIALIKHSMK